MRGRGASSGLAWSAARYSGSSVKVGSPLVWLSNCLKVTARQSSRGSPGKYSPIVSFRERVPLLTSESATAPLKALEVLAMAHAVVCAKGQIALQITDTEGVDLPVLAPLHDGDDARRAAGHGDQLLERAVEGGVGAFGLLRGTPVRAVVFAGADRGNGQGHPSGEQQRSHRRRKHKYSSSFHRRPFTRAHNGRLPFPGSSSPGLVALCRRLPFDGWGRGRTPGRPSGRSRPIGHPPPGRGRFASRAGQSTLNKRKGVAYPPLPLRPRGYARCGITFAGAIRGTWRPRIPGFPSPDPCR